MSNAWALKKLWVIIEVPSRPVRWRIVPRATPAPAIASAYTNEIGPAQPMRCAAPKSTDVTPMPMIGPYRLTSRV